MDEVCSSNSKDNVLSPELKHDMIIKLMSPNKFLPYQFKLPRTSIKQYPRKNRYLFQYKMAKPWFVDTNTSTLLYSPNSTSDCESYCVYKSIQVSSRSSKIMRALSSVRHSFRDETIGVRKSLNFDSTPSPKGSSYDGSSTSSFSIDTPSSVLNSSSIDSTDSNVPMTSAESIDENQNRTPQQNRKSGKRTDTKKNKSIRTRTHYLMSLLKNEHKERTDKNANHRSSHPFCSFNPFAEPKGLNRIITASTPRNLSQEFNQELDDRSHTPENLINVIPESISAIKKSHKKEKLYCHEEQSSTQLTNVSVKKGNLHSRTSMESSRTDMIAESNYNAASENESQKKNRNIKRALIYNDESCNTRLDSSVYQITTPTDNDPLESELDQIGNDKMQYIDSNDESRKVNMQINICLTDHNDEEKDSSNENIRNEEINQLSLQKESSDSSNVTSENRMASSESNLSISQNANIVVTPENNINMIKYVLTESIKKSHKKIKHGNRKPLFKTEDTYKKMELAKSEVVEVCNIDQNIKSQIADTIYVPSSQNSEFNRPSTPENVNSSRLLLLNFNSVKKSHKKDKRSKRTSSFTEYRDYEYHRKVNNSLQKSRYEQEITRKTLRRNKSLRSKESPDMSPKKKKSVSMSLQSSTPKFLSAFVSLECKDINEFKIFTPIKKPPISMAVMNNVSAAEMSQEKDKSTQTTSKEIDCFRCVTPVARNFEELRKNDLTSECDNSKRFETDVSVLKAMDTANLKDKNGRSTPINMSTTELLCNIDSIKKSHKKNKHSHRKRTILKKERSYIEENVNFANNEKMLAEPITSFLKHHVDKHCFKKEMCSFMREKEKNKSHKETVYDDPQPSTSRGGDNMENVKNTKCKFLDTTPPNSLTAMNLMKLVHTTSIKKSHKKERDINAQTKYILMVQEHDLSDDGSIFDEEDRLNFIENNSTVQDNDK